MSSPPFPSARPISGTDSLMAKILSDARRAWLALLVIAGFAALAACFWSFILDDSYITYRYAENLVNSGQLTWNVGEDPVEGATSFLWVLVSATAILLHISPEAFTQAASLLAVLSLLLWLDRQSRGFPAVTRIALVAGVGLSAPLVLHASQGMETALSATLLFFASLRLIRAIEAPTIPNLLAWFALMFVATLGRPELAIFAAAASAATLVLFSTNRNLQALSTFVAVGVGFAVLGAAFVYWRYSYFGHLLPNSAYIKNAGKFSFDSVRSVVAFVTLVLLPYILMIVRSVLRHTRRWRDRAGILPVFIAVLVSLGYYATIEPIQGYVFRFPIVVYPLVLLMIWYFERQAGEREGDSATPRRPTPATIIAGAFFILWPLLLFSPANHEIRHRSQIDRVLVGRALQGLGGTMFVSESGALPYFSGWRAYDWLGLNSEFIARNGITPEFLESIAPDLVMSLSEDWAPNPTPAVIHDYMAANRFAVVAAIVKTGFEDRPAKAYHLYWVRTTSPLCRQIVKRIRNVPGIAFADPAALGQTRAFPVAPADSGKSPANSAGAC